MHKTLTLRIVQFRFYDNTNFASCDEVNQQLLSINSKPQPPQPATPPWCRYQKQKPQCEGN